MSSRSGLKILLLEDNPDHRLLEKKALQTLSQDTQVEATAAPEHAVELLQARPFDLVVADYRLPEMDGLAFLQSIRDLRIRTPVVIVTGLGNERIAVEALKAGATDYVVKETGYLELLPSVARRAISAFRTERELEQAQTELTESESRYRDLVNNLAAIVWEAVPKSFEFTFVSPYAERILGFRLRHWLEPEQSWPNLIHPEDRETWIRSRTAVSRGIQCPPLEYRALDSSDRVVWLRESVRLVDCPRRGKVLRGLTFDITSQKKAEQQSRQLQIQLFQSQKLESLGTLAGGIAHDFNNLLQGVYGHSALLLRQLEPDHKGYSSVRTILRSAQKARDLTGQLLNFCRPQESDSRVCNLNQLIDESLGLLRQIIPASVQIRKDLEPGLANVEGEPSQLQQVLMNLCVNARDAMPEGGTLTIGTRNCTGSEGTGKAVAVGVRDTGSGISKDIEPRIFDPFFTTKEVGKGTGLGLAVVHRIISRHGGRIEIDSQPRKGTSIVFRLPASDKPLLVGLETQSGDGRGSETILVADDENIVRRLACQILQDYGYHTLSAGDGRTALRIYQQNQRKVDMVLLDLTMPGLSGGECLRRLEEFDPGIKLVLSSGGALEDQEFFLGQSYPFLPKPYGPDELVKVIRETLDTAVPATHSELLGQHPRSA